MKKMKINGKTYPAIQTIGAFVLFEELAGKPVAELKQDSISEVSLLVWCCIKSAMRRQGEECDLTYEAFCDALDPAQFAEIAASALAIKGDESADPKKK